MLKSLVPALSAALLVGGTLAVPAVAEEAPEHAYLEKFEGTWQGEGKVRLSQNAPMMTVSCKLSGTAEGGRVDLRGSCGKGVLRSSVQASLRYDAASRAYTGSWAAGSSNAGLAGKRRGNRIALAVSAPQEPARSLVLSLAGASRLQFTMIRRDENATVLAMSLGKS